MRIDRVSNLGDVSASLQDVAKRLIAREQPPLYRHPVSLPITGERTYLFTALDRVSAVCGFFPSRIFSRRPQKRSRGALFRLPRTGDPIFAPAPEYRQ